MSKLLINRYYNDLHGVMHAGRTRNETSITFAFANLLRAYAEQKNFQLVEQFEFVGKSGKRIRPDGVLRYFGGIDVGYWEAKDTKDKLDVEINKKLNEAGYPSRNIVFEDTNTAVLIQENVEVMRVSMREWNLLDDLLDKFIGYEPAEVKEFNKALVEFKDNVPRIVEGLRELMKTEADTNAAFREKRDAFLEIARNEINPEITAEDIREMIIQHVLTEDIFTNVFDDAEFHRSNNVARELENVIHTFMTREVRKNYLSRIEYFYKAIRDAASGITDNHEKQKFLKTVYENFYKVYNPKGADKLGVVYTPNEIVRFMIDATDWLLDKHFGTSLSDRGVDILDPATGTGTFIAELIDKISIVDLEYKYEHELHANEVAILPYYIANLNIEYTYQQRKGTYKEFKNICFVDTLDNTDALAYSGKQLMLGGISSENAVRIKKQNAKRISVIIGNPPYNANQANFNDFNKNRDYKEIDKRIRDSYVKHSTAQKTKVYDMYARFYRWSMDRIDENGVLAFITNRSFVDSRTFDGFRKVVEDEFDVAYIIDTRSDVRANPKIAGTSHNVFGIQTGVAIMFLVKKQTEDKPDKRKCKIYYTSLDDFWRKEEKLEWLRDNPIEKIAFEHIKPDEKHNWINQTDNDFESLLPLIDKDVKLGRIEEAVFQLFSLGVVTARDEWVSDYEKITLSKKVNFLIDSYNKDLKKFKGKTKDKIKEEISKNSNSRIKWSRAVVNDIANGKKYVFDEKKIIDSIYRPFIKKPLYFSKELNEMQYQMPKVFTGENIVIAFSGEGSSKPFQVLAQNKIYNHDLLEKTQCLPLYAYDSNGENPNQKHENITDWGLNQFQSNYKSADGARITKQDIFYYTYAVLHSPVYRKKYEQNLKREFPRLPFYDDFFQWKRWGEELMNLHVGYESVEPFALERNDLDVPAKRKIKQANLFAGKSEAEDESFVARVQTKLRADKEAGAILIDSITTLSGIPPLAWEYKLGNRSALEWVLDQYKEKKPQDATIRERFDTYRFEDYKEAVVDLLMRVCNVSVKTTEIVSRMPDA